MKKLTILGVITALLLLPFLSACRSETQVTTPPPSGTTPTPTSSMPPFTGTPIPYGELPSSTGAELSDDIIFTPGGVAYRANVFDGSPHPWPSIQSENAALGSGSDILDISYRDNIETEAGTSRNNIIDVYKRDSHLMDNTLELYSIAVPDGISLFIGSGGGLIGEIRVVVVIEVNSDIAPGKYTFKIGIELDGKYYGTVPCTVNVV